MISNILHKTSTLICSSQGVAVSVSILMVTIFCYLWTLKNKRKEKMAAAPLPPGPMGLPLVGYLPFLGSDLHRSLAELASVYGPIYKLWFGNTLFIVLSSAELAKQMFRDHDLIFANRVPSIAASAATYGGRDIITSTYGPEWRILRKVLVREMLSNSTLDGCYSLRRHEIRKTIRDVYMKIGLPMDIGETIFRTEFNVMMNLLWGSMIQGEKSSIAGGSKFQEVTSEILEVVAKPNVSDFVPMLARFDLQGIEQKIKKLFIWVDQFFDSIIDQRMKEEDVVKGEGTFKKKEHKDFLQILLKLKEQEDTTTPITMSQIKALLLDFVVGGTDTTSTMVVWAMAEMLRHPWIMKKAQEELADTVGMNNIVEESHLPKLQYLDAIVKETFRLHPVAPLTVPRCPNVSCTLGGYTIPKGTRVCLNIWALHRDPQVWDNPLEFKPERFLNDPSMWDYSGQNFQFLPFGSGRRRCAGVPLGERMLKYTLASLLHSFEWQLPEGIEIDLSETFGIVLKKRTPLIAIPTQRLPNLELYA